MPEPRYPQKGAQNPRPQGPAGYTSWRFPLPKEVADRAQGISTCLNAGLWLDHFTEWEERRGELKRAEASDKRQRIPKSLNIPELCTLLSAWRNRWERMLDGYKAQGYSVQRFTLRAASRVIVGLGAESVLETSIRLHRIYGFPIIPGSALKGLARAYAELVEGENENDPLLFTDVFGKSPPDAQAGKVIFFDAIPANPADLKLELDVMNPHYAPYYQGTQPPADYHNPVPVFFLTIGSDSEFLFTMVAKEQGLADRAKEWLTKALTEMGVGAKTVAGYGLWQEIQKADYGLSAEHPVAEEIRPSSLSSSRPAILSALPKKLDERIPAEVVDNSQKPIKVRLLVQGYLEQTIPCVGVRNLSSFLPGTFVWVTISQKANDGTIRQVSLAGLWKPI